MPRPTFALVLLVTSFCGQLFGQASATGAVNGTVTDQSGQIVAGAKVVLLAESTNIATTVTTNGEGQYRIQNVLPTLYNLTVQGPGFKVLKVAPFRLNVNQTLTVDVMLHVGELNQTVDVSAQAELVQRTTVELQTVIQAKAMRDLPLNGRDYTSLIQLTPGANGTRVNGQWADGNSFLLDGGVNTTVMGGSSAYKPILDTIQEFSISSHSDKAEYGGVTGATIQVASRSGGNTLTGSAWEFVRNDIFTARSPITQATLAKPPAFRQNQFGGTFGGPVVIPKVYNGKNKTFFFFATEYYRFRRGTVSQTRVPTANELAGNFSDSAFGRNIFDPTTTAADNSRRQFPNNIIPASRIEKMTQGYINLRLPEPNYYNPANLTVNRFDVFAARTNKQDYSLKIDHKFSDKDNVWFRYGLLNNNARTQPSLKSTLDIPENRRSFGVNWTHLFAPTLISEVRFSYSKHPYRQLVNVEGGTAAVEALGFGHSKVDTFTYPNLSAGGISLPNLNYNYATLTSLPYAFSGSLNWIKGRHNVKYGLQLTRKDFGNVQFSHNYAFSTIQTNNPLSAGTTGIEFASMLLGLPNTSNHQDGSYHEAFTNWGAYVQDEWKVRSNLTINLGLRFDAFPLPNFDRGAFGLPGIVNDWDWKTGEWLIGGTKLPPACNVAKIAPCLPGDGDLTKIASGGKIRLADYKGVRHPINDNFSPRVSMAYSLTNKTVLRAGYGIYFDTESSTAQEAQNTQGSWPSNGSVPGTWNQLGEAFTTIRQVDALSISPLTTGAPWGRNTYYWDPRKKNALIQQYNFDIQREIDKNLLITVAYVGSRGSRLDMNVSANSLATPGPALTAAELTAKRPFPHMIRDVLYGTDLGRTYYNSLQVKVDRRFDNGLYGLVSYTWSKAMDNGSDGFYSGNAQNFYNLAAEHGVSNSDRTHMLRVSGVYELPLGTGKRWLSKGPAAYVLGNWQFNTINSLTSGTPIVLSVAGDVANVGNTVKTYARPNVTGDPKISNPTMDRWFNTTAFTVPVASFGNAGRGLIRNPGFVNSDMSLFKNIPITETLSAQLRVEAFNVFNIQNPGGVNGNASTGNTNFGRITSNTGSPRDVQLALKIMF